MDRRGFIKGSGMGMAAFLLSGCGLSSERAQEANANAQGFIPGEASAKAMKITVITGSPHAKGTSALLADQFIKGAETAGHVAFRFDAAFEDIHSCLGCGQCGQNGPCVQKDAIEQKLMPNLLSADLVAFVTPLYYFGMSSQLKTVVDRFYSSHAPLMNSKKKAVLLATAGTKLDWTMTDLVHHYQTVLKYLQWENRGMVLAVGCAKREQAEDSSFPEQAYELGQKV